MSQVSSFLFVLWFTLPGFYSRQSAPSTPPCQEVESNHNSLPPSSCMLKEGVFHGHLLCLMMWWEFCSCVWRQCNFSLQVLKEGICHLKVSFWLLQNFRIGISTNWVKQLNWFLCMYQLKKSNFGAYLFYHVALVMGLHRLGYNCKKLHKTHSMLLPE